MLQPSKNTKKAAGTVNKIVKSSAISKILSNIPFADEVYDVANTLQGFKEGDYKKIGSNIIGALLPGISGKSFEAVAEDWLPATPEIEKKKMQFNLKSSPAERKKLFKKYGPGYLSNPQFIKDYKLAFGTGEEGIELPDMFNEMIQTDFQELPTEKLFVQETPAQKAAREAREARIAERAKLVAIQKAKNAVRLAPIEAAQQKRYENWRNSSEDNLTKTYDDWQEELKEAQKGPDVPLEGLEIGKAKKGYSTKGSCTVDTKIEKVKLGLGTNINGIMKTKMNPIKKYANGSDAKGMNPNHYIISPDEALNDYNIMLAKAENAAVNNPWAPYVAAIGGAATNFLSGSAGLLTNKGDFTVSGSAPDTTNPAFQSSINDRYKTAANGMNNIQADVEVEGGEMYETPQGQVGEFQGPSHEQGGIPLEVGQEVQEGTKVYSDRLKIGNKTLAERKETRERQIANLEKTASQPLIDQAVKNASKRKMMAIQKEEAADLDFQDKVNNIQQMADTMVAAFGTGMAGLQDNPIGDSMRYGYGSGMTGVQKYAWGTDDTGVDPIYGNEDNKIKNFQSWLGVYSDGIAGKKTQKAWDEYQRPKGNTTSTYLFPWQSWEGKKPGEEEAFYTPMGLTPGGRQFKQVVDLTPAGMAKTSTAADLLRQSVQNSNIDVNKDGVPEDLSYNPNINYEALNNFKIGEGINDNASLSYGDPYAADGVNRQVPKETFMTPVSAYGNGIDTGVAKTNSAEEEGVEKPTAMGNLMRSLPGMGDMTKLVGNYLGMTSGIKTATEQRASDVTKTNVYRNAGEESQRLLDNAKQGIETSKAQAIVKANANTRTGRKGARNSARGVNQMRGMDWLYDTALNQQVADITAGAAQQMSGIDIQKSGVAMNADQLKGQGDWQARMANDADKDAYYTALGLGRKDYATGMQQSGKDLNDMKQNKVIEGLMKQYGKWFKGNADGTLANKDETSAKEKEQIFLGPDGKTKFKLGKDNKLIQVT